MRLFGVIAATATAYLVYEMIFQGFTPEVLVIAIFGSAYAVHLKSQVERRVLSSWRPEFSIYTIWHAFFWFTYWYAFWHGMVGTESSLAMSFIALTVLVTPLCIKLYRRNTTLRFFFEFTISTLIILTGIFLMKLNLSVSELDASQFSRRIEAITVYPLACMLIAVAAEAGQELCKVALATNVNEGRLVFAQDREAPAGANAGDVAVKTIAIQSVPICLAFSLLMWIIHSTHGRPHWMSPTLSAGLTAFWYVFWFAVLGLFGNYARQRLINPMLSRGFDHEAIAPWLAVRPLIYLALAALVLMLLPPLCGGNQCIFSMVDIDWRRLHFTHNPLSSARLQQYFFGECEYIGNTDFLSLIKKSYEMRAGSRWIGALCAAPTCARLLRGSLVCAAPRQK